jgi:peptidoglycan hydrolase CwlO-like protein
MTFEHEDLEEEDAMLTAENNSGGATSSSSSIGNQQLLKERVDDLFEKASTEMQKIRELQHSVHVLQEYVKELENKITFLSENVWLKHQR